MMVRVEVAADRALRRHSGQGASDDQTKKVSLHGIDLVAVTRNAYLRSRRKGGASKLAKNAAAKDGFPIHAIKSALYRFAGQSGRPAGEVRKRHDTTFSVQDAHPNRRAASGCRLNSSHFFHSAVADALQPNQCHSRQEGQALDQQDCSEQIGFEEPVKVCHEDGDAAGD
jgi:hypothetical protein